jgi:hypothetical protein
VIRTAIELRLVRPRLAHENTAVVQGCVPSVDLKGDSYRLRDKDLGARPGAQPAEIA